MDYYSGYWKKLISFITHNTRNTQQYNTMHKRQISIWINHYLNNVVVCSYGNILFSVYSINNHKEKLVWELFIQQRNSSSFARITFWKVVELDLLQLLFWLYKSTADMLLLRSRRSDFWILDSLTSSESHDDEDWTKSSLFSQLSFLT